MNKNVKYLCVSCDFHGFRVKILKKDGLFHVENSESLFWIEFIRINKNVKNLFLWGFLFIYWWCVSLCGLSWWISKYIWGDGWHFLNRLFFTERDLLWTEFALNFCWDWLNLLNKIKKYSLNSLIFEKIAGLNSVLCEKDRDFFIFKNK